MDERMMRAKEILGLRRLPIKIGFLDAPPAALARWSGGPVAAGCVFWDHAMDGKSFYTLPADHWNCAIGSHTHNIGLPADRSGELGATIGFMVETRYLDPAEVPGIATLARAPGAVAYAPASSEAFAADVVLMAATPAQATLVYEAALRAGIAQGPAGASSRPSCAILPAAAQSSVVAISFGCRGNRTFTAVGDGEMYLSIPGPRWDDFVDRLLEVQRSNLTMGNYYQAQAAKFKAPGGKGTSSR
jgi:uncharacterized protein (DUF169 family)